MMVESAGWRWHSARLIEKQTRTDSQIDEYGAHVVWQLARCAKLEQSMLRSDKVAVDRSTRPLPKMGCCGGGRGESKSAVNDVQNDERLWRVARGKRRLCTDESSQDAIY